MANTHNHLQQDLQNTVRVGLDPGLVIPAKKIHTVSDQLTAL